MNITEWLNSSVCLPTGFVIIASILIVLWLIEIILKD